MENKINREELEAALNILTGDNGRIYPACALSNPEAAAHDAVVDALHIVMGEDFTNYLDRYEWDFMSDKERSEYAEDYFEFCEACDSFNSSIINKAIIDAKQELELCE
jgi:hypothetical protein